MTMQIHSSRITKENDFLLSGIAEAAPWAIWILPTGLTLEEPDAQALLNGFGDLRCILWHTSDGGAHTQRVKDHLRALGEWPDLTRGIFATGTLNYFSLSRTTYSDVAWIHACAPASLVAFLSRSTAGIDSTLSFIPGDDRCAQAWTDAVQGLEWLWLLRTTRQSS